MKRVIVNTLKELIGGRVSAGMSVSKEEAIFYHTDGTRIVMNKRDPIRLMMGKIILGEVAIGKVKK